MTFYFIFESNAIFSNCVIPLVCWVQSEEDELELVSLGCCLREQDAENVFYYRFLTVVSLHILNNSSVPLVADKNTFVLSNFKTRPIQVENTSKVQCFPFVNLYYFSWKYYCFSWREHWKRALQSNCPCV